MDGDTIQKELRRNRSTLVVVGLGVIAFGAWSVVKIVLMLLLDPDAFFETLGLTEIVSENAITRAVGFAVPGVFLALDLALRLFIGLRARREGLARKKAGMVYLVLACLLAVFTVWSDVSVLIQTLSAGEGIGASIVTYASKLSGTAGGDIDNAVVAIVVELTSLATMVELIVAAVRVKRFGRLAAAREA